MLLLTLIGLASILAPAILYCLECGSHDESDLWHWLAGKSIDQILTMGAMQVAGGFLLNASVIVRGSF